MKTRAGRAIEEFLKYDKRKEVAASEAYIKSWFEKNYKTLDFDKILKRSLKIKTNELRSLVSGWDKKKEKER